MTTSQDVAVTYTGTDNPFKDRIYRSGLTFTPGQTRLVPLTLAQRFLRHADVFAVGKTAAQLAEQAEAAKLAAEQAADDDRAAAQGDAKRLADEADAARQAADAQKTEPSDQDTAQVLEQQKQEQDKQRQQEDARFTLLDSIDSMDRAAVISWADQHYRQKIPGNVGVAKARDIAKGFIDQYGMPA